MDIVEDAEWDRAAEAEILAANEGFNEELDVEVEVEKKVVVEKNAKTSRPPPPYATRSRQSARRDWPRGSWPRRGRRTPPSSGESCIKHRQNASDL